MHLEAIHGLEAPVLQGVVRGELEPKVLALGHHDGREVVAAVPAYQLAVPVLVPLIGCFSTTLVPQNMLFKYRKSSISCCRSTGLPARCTCFSTTKQVAISTTLVPH